MHLASRGDPVENRLSILSLARPQASPPFKWVTLSEERTFSSGLGQAVICSLCSGGAVVLGDVHVHGHEVLLALRQSALGLFLGPLRSLAM